MKFIQFFVMLMMVVSEATATSTWYPYQGTRIETVDIVGPIAADSDYLANDLPISGTGSNNVERVCDVDRQISVTPNKQITGNIYVLGLTKSGYINTTFTFANSSVTQRSSVAYSKITKITYNVSTSDATIDVGVTDNLGIGKDVVDTAQVIAASFGNIRESSFPAVTVGDVDESLIDIDSELDGSSTVRVYIVTNI